MIHIDNKADCCGCRACVQSCPFGAISMKKDREGFLYPKINDSLCSECGLCEKVCPVKNQTDGILPIRCYAAISNNDELRKNSSSGGVFSELAEYVIKEGGIVFGAAFNERFEVSHIMISSLDDLKQLRGSKYLQSDIGNTFVLCKESLDKGIPVLFSGTPCQISGLRRFLKKKYSNLFLIDLICHGVPSPDVWQRYLKGKFGTITDISSISFRDKTNGWKSYRLAISGNGVIKYSSQINGDVYMQLFLQNIILRPSCYECPAKAGKSGSDITIADFWGIENVVPEMDDDKGISLIMVNTNQGLELLHSIESELKITVVSHADAIRNNSSWSVSVEKDKRRERFFKCYRFWLSFEKGAESLLKEKPSYAKKLLNKSRLIIRLIKHIIGEKCTYRTEK